jgi:hypothetical protein
MALPPGGGLLDVTQQETIDAGDELRRDVAFERERPDAGKRVWIVHHARGGAGERHREDDRCEYR